MLVVQTHETTHTHTIIIKITGNQALHYAAEFHHKPIIMFLLKNGGDPISKNNVHMHTLSLSV
jgi:ankyrin repeat protein